MTTNIMIDLETLATTPDAVILSIGACRFDLDSGEVFYGNEANSFYRSVSIDSQPGRHIAEETIAWWMGQTKEAQGVFAEPKCSLASALRALRDWMEWNRGFGDINATNVWSNGADFDLPILTHAYAQAGLKRPWAPYAGRCYRTAKNLPGAREVKVPRLGEHHNALHDSIFQATHVCAIYARLFGTQSAEVAA